MKLSLIQTSINRKEELSRFVDSLNSQINIDFSNIEYVFVDQGNNEDIFHNINKFIKFKYTKVPICSLSKARNIGISLANGDYIGIPDDDCWYDNDTLSKIVNRISQHNISGIIADAKNEDNVKINNSPDKESAITYTNHCGALSISIFLKFDKRVFFDENIGVGSKYGLLSGEETDYLLTYMEYNPDFKIIYDPTIIVRHPVAKKQNFNNYLEKNYFYARGAGYVLRKHKYSLKYKITSFIRPLVGIFCYLFVDTFKCKKSFYLLKGRIEGYLFKL